ncbi:orotidine-5'-phosphate decarboxylase [Candidatus Regiella insecticola]|uniref:Orotidine 5'-phosphate decarboxylase n=1 Tax=Candidatus Regiella insecticola TaxID=138073 RepID=A0A6L2ZRS6_9ENTR|nr:orotidine-5'-phosphate decarboxylase [Candidatus Regiella insecticola]GFN46898.1 orotidine 5'-phosphate decarboxylase [Candidatus Regiella insecticola]
MQVKIESDMNANASPIIVALDYADINNALAFVDRISPQDCRLKVGKEMFTSQGPQWITKLQDRGFDIFLDVKFHDIPHTTAQAVKAAADLGVWMVNVHAVGGEKMLVAAKEALSNSNFGKKAPLLIAVTVLTSMDEDDLSAVGIDDCVNDQVERLAKLSRNCGLDGVVCSGREAAHLKNCCGTTFKLVTPGIRPVDSVVGDQQRVMTPKQALDAGADFLVIGRPITESKEPAKALKAIRDSLVS